MSGINIDGFNFNTIYVFNSLQLDERDTADELFNDTIKVRGYQLSELETHLIDIPDRDALFAELGKINARCKNDGECPIIHLEMHGNEHGIEVRSGEFVSWIEFKGSLTDINISCKLNLFITLAVCKGSYLMQLIKPSDPAPFWGIVGSFETIENYDLLVRYSEFYDSLLTEFDFNKAEVALYRQNPSLPTDYRFINAELTFKNIMRGYYANKFGSISILKARFNDIIREEKIKHKSKEECNEHFKKFAVMAVKTKEEYFLKYRNIFFMNNVYSDNMQRFKIAFSDVS
jgi:hypothetical protein